MRAIFFFLLRLTKFLAFLLVVEMLKMSYAGFLVLKGYFMLRMLMLILLPLMFKLLVRRALTLFGVDYGNSKCLLRFVNFLGVLVGTLYLMD